MQKTVHRASTGATPMDINDENDEERALMDSHDGASNNMLNGNDMKLKQSGIISIDKENEIENNNNNNNNVHDHKLGATSFWGFTMIIVGTLMYGIFSIINRLSMLGQKSTPYQSAAAMAIAELGKFVSSLFLLFNEKGLMASLIIIKNQTMQDWITFAMPAALYSFTNNLDFYILQYMDPGSMQVLVQTKIITTTLLWWYWFRQSISRQQWISIILLCLGSMLVVFKDDYSNNNANTMYVEWPLGPLYVLIQISLSAIAGIYTEAIYKKQGRTRSIHLENLSMYFWGTMANFMQYAVNDNKNSDAMSSKWDLLYGFNYWTWLLIAVYILKGLAIAQVMKFFSNIVKLFMTGGSIIVTGVLTYIVFGLQWTWAYFIGLVLVTFSVILYKTDKKIC